MAGSEILELDLELDVDYNEFDDEFQEKIPQTVKNSNKQVYNDTNTTELTENISNELADVRPTFKNEISNERNFEQVGNSKLKLSKLGLTDSEEGEMKSEDDLSLDSKSSKANRVQNEVVQKDVADDILFLAKKGESLTTNKIAEDEDHAMDVDVDQLLESEDETNCEVEEKKPSQGNEDQVMRVLHRTRAGRKKKNKRLKYLKLRVQSERKVHPKIGRLFRPLTAKESDTAELLAKQLADRLEEEKDDLILRVVKILGHKKAIEIFEETKKIQVEGGMFTSDNYRRRTSGGIFLTIMKTHGYATKEQMKEIYSEEREKEKQLVKERLQQQKELEERQKHDLRELLTKKKEMLTELKEMENKVD